MVDAEAGDGICVVGLLTVVVADVAEEDAILLVALPVELVLRG